MEQGINKSRLAESAGISRQMLSNWIQKDQVPSPQSFRRLLKAMTKLTEREREKLKKEHSIAWAEVSGRKKKRDGEKAYLYALQRISKIYRVDYHTTVSMRDIGEGTEYDKHQIQKMSEISKLRYLGRLEEDKRLITQLQMEAEEELLTTDAILTLYPTLRSLPGLQWSLSIKQSSKTQKWESSSPALNITYGSSGASLDSKDMISAIRSIARVLKVSPKTAKEVLQELAINALGHNLAMVNAKDRDDDSFVIPRKLATKALYCLGEVSDLKSGMLSWKDAKLVPFLVQARETARELLRQYVKNEAEREIAQLLIKHLTKSFPSF